MNAVTQALPMSSAQAQASPQARPTGRTTAPAVVPPPRSAARRSRGLPERFGLAVLVLAAHVGGLAALSYFGNKPTPPQPIQPIEIAFIPMEAPPQPEPVVTPPPPPVRKPPPKRPEMTRPKPPRPVPQPVVEQTTTSPQALTAPAETAPPQPAAPPVAETAPAPAPAPAPVVAARFDADYLNNPRPGYPPLSRRMREEGKVMLRVQVTTEGLPGQIEIARSSGFERLDQAAREAVTRWRFVAARQGDRPIEAWVLVPVVFKLTEGR